MPTDVKPHQLYKQISGVTLSYSETPGSSGVLGGTSWEALDATIASPITVYWVNRQYIDLAGWTKEELTMFTRGVDIQKQLMPLSNAGNVSAGINEMDVLSTRALTDLECEVYATGLGGVTLAPGGGGPGFLPSTMSLMEVIYGEIAQYAQNTQIPGTYIRTNVETFGSGNPTATDKLHWTRIYYAVLPADGDAFVIHPTNLVIQTTTAKEKDLVWMERLRRSYVLQDQADI
jgi:hypothetical protein